MGSFSELSLLKVEDFWQFEKFYDYFSQNN